MADDNKLRAARSGSFRAGPEGSGRSQPSAGDPLAELAKLIGQDDLFDQMRRDAARQSRNAHAAAPSRDPHNARIEPTLYTDGNAAQAAGLRGSYEPQPAPGSAAPYRQPASQDHHSQDHHSQDHYSLDHHERDHFSEPLAPRAAAGRPPQGVVDPYADRGAADDAYDQRAHDPYQQDYQQHYDYSESHPPAEYAESAAHDYAQPHAYAQQYDDPAFDPAYAYHDAAHADQAVPAARRGGGLMTFGAVAGLALLGTAGAFGYWALSGNRASGEPPVITANASPTKVAPAPQARSAPAGGFDRSQTTGQGERVVPREEQPIELQQPRGATARTTPGGVAGLPGQSAATMVAPTTTGALANPDEPRRVKTVAIRPDGSIIQDSERAGSVPPPRRESAAAPAPSRQMAALPPATQAPEPAPAAGTHVVQVASQRSQEDAQASFRALQAKYPSVLGNRDALIRKVDLGTRGIFYRVQVGPFASSEQANDLCGNLKAAGGQCIVQRN